MTLELEGNVLLERSHTRRWVSIVAVVVPVAAFVMVAWSFIRVYIVPPTVAIPSPMMLAAAPPAPFAEVEAAQLTIPQSVATAEPEPPAANPRTEIAPALPMFATLAVAPPSLVSASPAYAELTQQPTQAASPAMVDEPAAIEPSEPIAGAVPLPRAKPHGPIALAGVVPLPRPRPTEAAPPPDLPAIDRHSIN